MHVSRAPSDAARTAGTSVEDATSLLSRLAGETDLCLIILDERDRIVFANGGFSRKFGFERDECTGQPLGKLLAEDDLRAHRRFGQAVPQNEKFEEQFLARTRTGEAIWISGLFRRVTDAHGDFRFTAALLQDVTESRILAFQRDVLEAIADGATLSDLTKLLCTRAENLAPDVVCSVIRIDEDRRLRPLAAPSLPVIYTKALDGEPIGPGVGSCGTAAHRGEPVFVADIMNDPLWAPYRHLPLPPGLRACWSVPIKLRSGRVAGTFAFYFRGPRGPKELHQRIVDACVHLCALAIERHEAEAHINRLAYFDHLTGLPNRGRLQYEIGRVLAAGCESAALLSIDIDHFKYVNDTLGHSTGDQLLVAVAKRLSFHAGNAGFVGRMGGDEFVMILPGCDADRANATAAEVVRSLARPIEIDGIVLPVSASIGISLYPDDAADQTDLLIAADVALYEAKRSGRGIHAFFRPEMNKRTEERMLLGAALRDSLSRGELRLHFQPQVRIADGIVYGAEALARWTHPALGEIPPDKFIPVAEETGLFAELGLWSLEEAARQLAEWRARGVMVPSVSVNLSALHFRNGDLAGAIDNILSSYQLHPAMLTLEITEGVMMEDGPAARETLNALHALGVGLAMDDFGTGFSSLSGLATMPFSELKIDRAFIEKLEYDSGTRAVVTAVIRIGQSLGMTVVAEGVENEAQFQVLKALGCHVSQGFFTGRPMDAREFRQWFVTGAPAPILSGREGS